MNIKEKSKANGFLPEKVLQIGEGNFLRAFADWQIDKANSKGFFQGSIVLCQPIQQGLTDLINEQQGNYTVLERGIENSTSIERPYIITSVTRCINPYDNFDALMEICRSPELQVIISNTTEAGIAYRCGDLASDRPPVSYPAKMTLMLFERFKAFKGDQGKGVLILPVELIDRNGENLKKYVLQYASEWGLPVEFTGWLEKSCCFANTLVDRIVTGYPKDEIGKITEKLGYEDRLLVTCEPFYLWVIEAPEKWRSVLPLDKAGLNVIWTDDMTPYRTRKVRILNGAHTVSVLAAYLSGHEIVLDMMKDKTFLKLLKKVIWEEIIPNIDLPEKELESFAESVLERFSNPFIYHRLLDISLNSVSKYKARCLPSLLDYFSKKGEIPEILTFGLAALIVFYRGKTTNGKYYGIRGSGTYEIRDDAEVIDFFSEMWKDDTDLTLKVLSNTALWGKDLTFIKGLCDKVSNHLENILKNGMKETVGALLEAL